MLCFIVPRTQINLYTFIHYIHNDVVPVPTILHSLYHYLCDIKQKIILYEKDWDIYKKYTNPFEFIHTHIPNKGFCISKHKPLSRSFYKMIELITMFKIDFADKPNITTFHLAEGPGGFIEAVAFLRKNKNDAYIGMTIIDNNNPDVPSWKKSNLFLDNNPNVFIERGSDETGNILSLDNFEYVVCKYGNSIDLITADGGFDFSADYNNQEINIVKLIYGQIAYALSMQKHGGCFILKIFDIFMSHTIDILAILSSFYEKVYIVKPQTSRYANSEKYVVCKNFLHDTNYHYYPYLYMSFKIMVNNPNTYVERFLNINHSCYFLTKIVDFTAVFGQTQIENIHATLQLIENKYKDYKINIYLKQNIQNCVRWCVQHNISYN